MKSVLKYLCFTLLISTGYNARAQRGMGMPFRYNSPYSVDRRFNRPQIAESRPGIKKLNAIRNNYINKRLNLTPEEADRFWPLYNQYQNELASIQALRRQNNANMQQSSIDRVNQDMYYDQQLVAVRSHYKDLFLKVLPADKVVSLYQSEREFRGELFKQLQERGQPDN
ncbi:hypothetical protein [Mucilaginibacter ginkgonis]|uniref:LTXXQ motif family protein n=1 Tax=Mucilaginibacter ginkgonis TaxID=2682091 RepID=A0A6I4I1C2_9SPHI|nr:hypothetical protein [Mucilaginibacter ginkgonis]QQL48502.1 hypothetical protein GO620_009895 [Mucilaginibacter ginkgonis]